MSIRSAALTLSVFAAAAVFAAEPARGPLRIGFSPNAPDYVQQAAQRLAEGVAASPVLTALKGEGAVERGPVALDEKPEKLAFSHLVTVGTPDDPLVRKAQRFRAKFDGKEGVYVFGYGAFNGDLGYIESGANPLLHSERIGSVPFETQLVTITGTTKEGIDAAVNAFLKDHLVNGLVADAGAWKRTEETLLDRDPLVPGQLGETGFKAPDGWQLFGVTDCTRDVCLGVKDAVKLEPRRAVLVKYTRPGELDGAGYENAFRHYLNGLDRLAYGNAVLSLFFDDEDSATVCARRLEDNGRIKDSRKPNADGDKLRAITISRTGTVVHLSTLP